VSAVVTPDAGPVSQASRGWRVPAVVRLAWLHTRSRRVPAALVALLACGVVLWAALVYHWWYGAGNGADELPSLLEGCAAAIIGVTTHGPFGEPERATGRWLSFLRPALVLALCAVAIGFLAVGAALAYDPKAGIGLYDGMFPVVRNLLGFTGVALLFSLVTGGLLSWIGPLAYVAICQFAAVAAYSEPLTWASRPPEDRGGWIAAMVVFAVGLAAYTIRGPRTRPSGELRGALGLPASRRRVRGEQVAASRVEAQALAVHEAIIAN
jgi:hypothetical protein